MEHAQQEQERKAWTLTHMVVWAQEMRITNPDIKVPNAKDVDTRVGDK